MFALYAINLAINVTLNELNNVVFVGCPEVTVPLIFPVTLFTPSGSKLIMNLVMGDLAA